MNIKEAKMEVEKAVKIYLEKDENGEYRVPLVRQRPLFLVGGPGYCTCIIFHDTPHQTECYWPALPERGNL